MLIDTEMSRASIFEMYSALYKFRKLFGLASSNVNLHQNCFINILRFFSYFLHPLQEEMMLKEFNSFPTITYQALVLDSLCIPRDRTCSLWSMVLISIMIFLNFVSFSKLYLTRFLSVFAQSRRNRILNSPV
jgi:hypothetical protein